MKIAVCLYGMPRNITETHENYKSLFCDFDVFAHFWSSTIPPELQNFNVKSFLVEDKSEYDTRAHAFVGVIAPDDFQEMRKIRSESGLEGFDRRWQIPGWESWPANTTSMWHSMTKSISLALAHECQTGEKYDRFVLLRTDLKFKQDFKIESTFVGDIHKFLMPSYHPGSRIDEWISDQIISLSSIAARKMTTLLQSSYHYYFAANVPEIPEIMLGFHMIQSGMKIGVSGMHYRDDYLYLKDDGIGI